MFRYSDPIVFHSEHDAMNVAVSICAGVSSGTVVYADEQLSVVV